MRWIFVTILCVNLALFAYSFFGSVGQVEPEVPVAAIAAPGVKGLVLLEYEAGQDLEVLGLGVADTGVVSVGADAVVDINLGDEAGALALGGEVEVGVDSGAKLTAVLGEGGDLSEVSSGVAFSGVVSTADELALQEQKGLPASVISESEVSEIVVDTAGSEKLCELVGPYEDETEAVGLQERLFDVGVVSQVKDLKVLIGKKYQVHIKPESSRNDAFKRLSELQSRGVDSYVILEGDLKYAVSLGLFRKKSFAERHVKSMAKLGLESKVKEIDQFSVEFWVMLKRPEAEKISDSTWKNVLNEKSKAERRQNICLDVASR